MSISISPIRNIGFSSVRNTQQKQNNKANNIPPSKISNINFGTNGSQLKHISKTLMLLNFAAYVPIIKNFGEYSIPVHNKNIADKMHSEYTPEEFDELYNFAQSKGVFDYIMNDKTGLVKTSFINSKENHLMADLIWITDTCHNMDLVKNKEPEKCTAVFNNVTKFYENQQGAFDNVISNPISYKHNGLIWAGEQHAGVGHCYDTKTGQPHPWYAKTRLESVGNYIQTGTDLIRTGLTGGKYGYKTADEIPDSVYTALSNCCAYLKAIHYPTARSCGAWEEQTFLNSLTSDTSICNEGFRNIMSLMYDETTNPEILKFREKILSTKHGYVFNDKSGLEQLLKDGEARIIETPNYETTCGDNVPPIKPGEEKCVERHYDAAMSFMPQTETLVSGDIIADSQKKLELLDELSWAIVRENGAIRYPGDNYLNLDYHLEPKKFSQDFEAEWFLVTEISKGYGAITKELIKAVENQEKEYTEVEPLLKTALSKQTEYLNRGYARITSPNTTKSNGYPCPEYKVPEAFEAVTGADGKIRYVPGAHPLTWAESSLYSASQLYKENLAKLATIKKA